MPEPSEFDIRIRILYVTGDRREVLVEEEVAGVLMEIWKTGATRVWFKHRSGVLMVNTDRIAEMYIGDDGEKTLTPRSGS